MADEITPEEKRGEVRRRRRYDWGSIKAVYVEGKVDDKGERSWPTLDEVAMLFDAAPNRVREQSSKEGWVNQRAAFQANLEKVRQEKRLATLSKEAVDLDGRALNVAKTGMALAQMRAGEVLQKAGALAKARAAKANNQPLSPEQERLLEDDFGGAAVDAKELEMLARAAEGWHRLGQRALGEVETTRTEITGMNGAPLQVQSDVRAEIVRDDGGQRLEGILIALQRAQLVELPAEPQRSIEHGGDEA